MIQFIVYSIRKDVGMRYLSDFTSPSWPNKIIGEDGPKKFSKYCSKVLDLFYSVGMSMIDGLGFSPTSFLGF